MRTRRLAAAAAAAITLPLALTACGDAMRAESNDGRIQIVTSFYPLQFVASQVAGDLADVSNLTPPAADPHHLELSPARTRDIGNADLVVTLGGFQPAVDDAIAARQPARVVDAADIVPLLSAAITGGHDCSQHDHSDHSHDHSHEGHSHGDHDHHHGSHDHDHATDDTHAHDDPHDEHGHFIYDDEHGHFIHNDPHADHVHDIAGMDPHFWLDPIKLSMLAHPIANALAEIDPANADTFVANADYLVQRLEELDAEFAAALAPFAGATLITNHTAFGYLAHRYGLHQVGVTGLDHDIEPSPARMREIRDIARQHNVSTVFYENLVSPRVIQTLANDLGIQARVLDTLEGLTQDKIAAGEDYISIMRANLTALTEGLTRP